MRVATAPRVRGTRDRSFEPSERAARPFFLHIHPAHSAAAHSAMGMLFVLRSLGNLHLGREQQARDGCGILQCKPRDLRWIENTLFVAAAPGPIKKEGPAKNGTFQLHTSALRKAIVRLRPPAIASS